MQHIKYMRLQSIKYTKKKKTVGYKKSSSQKNFFGKKCSKKEFIITMHPSHYKTHKKEYNFKQQLQGCCLQ